MIAAGWFSTVVVVGSLMAPAQGDPGARLYGRVHAADGSVYEGFIRWDRNEAAWADVLDGSKSLPRSNFVDAQRMRGERRHRERREHSVEVFGIRISWDEDDDGAPETAESGIRFGHLESLVVIDRQTALLRLKSGEEVELRGGSTDLGTDIRSVIVDDRRYGSVELGWRDLDSVDFFRAPPGAMPTAERLHGTVYDRWGNAYAGYVAWDMRHALADDVLRGEERGRGRSVPFSSIAAIERASSRSAVVTLLSGEELVLENRDDVSRGNGGIQVSDPELGMVTLGWNEFEAVRFHAPERQIGYDDFDGGHVLRASVETRDGAVYRGWIRWDNDEEGTWELLDGSHRGVRFDVELANVAIIRRLGSRSADVTLRDGRTFELEGSNDVNRDNKGVWIEEDAGTAVLVEWYDLVEVVFEDASGR